MPRFTKSLMDPRIIRLIPTFRKALASLAGKAALGALGIPHAWFTPFLESLTSSEVESLLGSGPYSIKTAFRAITEARTVPYYTEKLAAAKRPEDIYRIVKQMPLGQKSITVLLASVSNQDESEQVRLLRAMWLAMQPRLYSKEDGDTVMNMAGVIGRMPGLFSKTGLAVEVSHNLHRSIARNEETISDQVPTIESLAYSSMVSGRPEAFLDHAAMSINSSKWRARDWWAANYYYNDISQVEAQFSRHLALRDSHLVCHDLGRAIEYLRATPTDRESKFVTRLQNRVLEGLKTVGISVAAYRSAEKLLKDGEWSGG